MKNNGESRKFNSFWYKKYPVHPHKGVCILLIRDKNLFLIKRKSNPDTGYRSIPGNYLNLGENIFPNHKKYCIKLII